MCLSHRKTWKTLTLGPPNADVEYRLALKEANIELCDNGDALLSECPFSRSSVARKLELVTCSSRTLGFRKGVTFDEICRRARTQGLKLCPAEVGPALRLHYLNQPSGEMLTIAMDPIRPPASFLNIFVLGNSEKRLWLTICVKCPDHPFGLRERLVFCK